MQSFFQTLVSGLSFGAVYALVALGFSLVYRTMGLSPRLVEVIGQTLQRLRADGIAMLLVEQNAMLTFAATSHCLVLENGEIALSGPAAELRANPRIRRLYLGL